MGTRTIYTSTMRVPIYASWKCPNCNKVNFSTGFIKCQSETSSSSWSNKKQNETKEKSSNYLKEEWVDYTLGILYHPETHSQEVRNALFMENTNCSQCGKKPKWDKGMDYLRLLNLALLPAIISGIVAFGLKNNIIAWSIFAVFLGIIMYGFITEKTYRRLMLNLPKQYIPVIGSQNEVLITCATKNSKKIPTPEECIEIVNKYSNESTNSTSSNQYGFCRKCGTALYSASDFCHKCGEKIIH